MAKRIAASTSPYLRQHADNPVDWYPWGDVAFEAARERNVPVFISIGYAACHWCHVMAHESFEDQEVGTVLNASFVCIKVDREEYPTVDHFYMSACAAMGRRGGWPLTILATADKRPFYCATYLPKNSQAGRLGLLDLLNRVSEMWESDQKKILQFGDELVELLDRVEVATTNGIVTGELLQTAFTALGNVFDADWGGFGSAPKFPTAHQLSFLLRYGIRYGDNDAFLMATRTLDAMRRGGIWDQLGGGFHRYSTDRFWKLPHFEKMLVDQATILNAYAEAAMITGDPVYASTCEAIISYVQRDLTSKSGCFFTSEDADSEGSEGLFYLWSWKELAEILNPDELEYLASDWRIDKAGNVHEEATGEPTGLNLLHGHVPAEKDSEWEMWSRVSARLFSIRENRPRPFRDEKILSDWNGAMIASLAVAGRALNRPSWISMADRSARAVLAQMYRENGTLYHSSLNGELSGEAFLDDFAYLVWGCIELFQATGSGYWLTTAIELSRQQIRLFWDAENGGFFLESAANLQTPVRQKLYSDSATPAGASVSILNMLRLHVATNDTEYLDIATMQLERSTAEASSAPTGFLSALSAADFSLGPALEIVIVSGNGSENGSEGLRSIVNQTYLPNALVIPLTESNRTDLNELMPHLEGYSAIEGKETVYICQDKVCNQPITDPMILRRELPPYMG